MNKWSHLPNARLIDWVLKSLKTDPNAWKAAWGKERDAEWATWHAAYAACDVWDAAWWNAANVAAWRAAAEMNNQIKLALLEGEAEEGKERDAEWAAWEAAKAARSAAGAILALIADDNAAQYLHIKLDKLKVWAILSEKPAARLLIPANKIWQREHARAENALQYN